MKSLLEFKSIVEEEKSSDYSKFDMLVRAGLANKAQMQRIHRILDKMQEEKPVFNNADRMILQNLFNKMVDLISNNKQIFTQARRAVHEETELEEGLKQKLTGLAVAGALAASGAAHARVTPGGEHDHANRFGISHTQQDVKKDSEKKTANAPSHSKEYLKSVADGSHPKPLMSKEKAQELLKKHYNEETELKEDSQDNLKDPPFVLLLKRKAIRVYPDRTKVALYHNKQLDKYFSVPYGPGIEGYVQAEEVELEEAVMDQLQKIKDTHQYGTVNHKDGSASKVDVQTAHAVLTVHKSLNDVNKKKFADMVARSAHHMRKAADFAFKHTK